VDPALPSWPHAIVVLGRDGKAEFPPWTPELLKLVPQQWSAIKEGEWLHMVAARPLAEFPSEPESLVKALVDWTLKRIGEIEPVLNAIGESGPA
jgi:hypothetical protein